MREQEIRPPAMVADCSKLEAEDMRKILLKRDRFERVDCPACQSSAHEQAFEKNGFEFVTCMDCQTLFINPRPTAAMLEEHYRSSASMEYWAKHIYPASEQKRRSSIFTPRAERVMELCRKHAVRAGRLYDAGAGFGTFCEEIDRLEYFREIIAVEPSAHLAESCRKKGLTVIEKTIEEADFADGSADVITNFELIEHLYQPRDFILKCAQLLAPGGLLILTTPNIRGFDLAVLRELSDNIQGPNHLNYFHRDSLCTLLEGCGLSVLETLTPGQLDVDVVKNKITTGVFNVDTQPFLKELFLNSYESVCESFQRFLADNGLSSHLWMVARRN